MDHRIVCVNTEHPHRHITQVGTGHNEWAWTRVWTVGEVRQALALGDRFYTVSPSTGKAAWVRADDCRVGGCLVRTIRSAPDAIADNNLDNMAGCRI